MSSTVSRLDVINNIRGELGFQSVATESSDASTVLIRKRLEQLLPFMLNKGNWVWNTVYREDSTPMVEALSGQFSYSYKLPSDYGRMFEMITPTRYMIVQGSICTDDAEIKYYYNTNASPFEGGDYTGMSPAFLEALTFYVASRVSTSITSNVELTKYLQGMSSSTLTDASMQNNYEKQALLPAYNNTDYSRSFLV